MRYAISTVCMPELQWAEALAACRTAGFRRVELLAIPGWVHVDPATISPEELTAAATRIGVEIVGLHAGGINGKSDDALAGSVDYIARVVDLAAKIGAKRVVFSGFPWPADMSTGERETILDRIATGLSQLLPVASTNNVTLCLENHYRCQMETLDDYQYVFAHLPAETPHIGATVDTGHFTASGVDPAAVVAALGKRVCNVHVKDIRGQESVALGCGDTDNASVAAALRRIGYDGDLTVELEVHDRSRALDYARDSYPYMLRLLAEED
jgi:sugar phosphate isomerase/epimerase